MVNLSIVLACIPLLLVTSLQELTLRPSAEYERFAKIGSSLFGATMSVSIEGPESVACENDVGQVAGGDGRRREASVHLVRTNPTTGAPTFRHPATYTG